MDVRSAVERFVSTYNAPGSDVYPLFADEVEWAEFPGGRSGGRDALFAALRAVRETVTDLNLAVRSMTADERSGTGVIESVWSGRRIADGAPMKAHTLWFLKFEDGLIVEERDYSVSMNPTA